ncbi:hypothetical protein HDV00_011784, partial [Rhizophlyctis rosea]
LELDKISKIQNQSIQKSNLTTLLDQATGSRPAEEKTARKADELEEQGQIPPDWNPVINAGGRSFRLQINSIGMSLPNFTQPITEFPATLHGYTAGHGTFAYISNLPSNVTFNRITDAIAIDWFNRRFVIVVELRGSEIMMILKGTEGGIDGYIFKRDLLVRAARSRFDLLIKQGQKLPLLLDVDGTLIQMVGDRFPEEDLDKVPNERRLPLSFKKPGANVASVQLAVMASTLLDFLREVNPLFEVSLFSLGSQRYIDAVKQELNHQLGGMVIAHAYSAADEYFAVGQHKKGIKCSLNLMVLDNSVGCEFVHPIILDDEEEVWSNGDQSYLLPVEPVVDANVWDVNLGGFVGILKDVHSAFFDKFDAWETNNRRGRLPEVKDLLFIAMRKYIRKATAKSL